MKVMLLTPPMTKIPHLMPPPRLGKKMMGEKVTVMQAARQSRVAAVGPTSPPWNLAFPYAFNTESGKVVWGRIVKIVAWLPMISARETFIAMMIPLAMGVFGSHPLNPTNVLTKLWWKVHRLPIWEVWKQPQLMPQLCILRIAPSLISLGSRWCPRRWDWENQSLNRNLNGCL